jgi:hypothetical protein
MNNQRNWVTISSDRLDLPTFSLGLSYWETVDGHLAVQGSQNYSTADPELVTA